MVVNWHSRVLEVNSFFDKAELPETLQLNVYSNITNVNKFVISHLKVVNNQTNEVYLPYLERLEQVKTIIQNKQNEQLFRMRKRI